MSPPTGDVDALFEPDVVQHPFDYYRDLRARDPVHEVIPGTFLVTRMDLVHEVVGRPEVFSSTAPGFLHRGDQPNALLRSIMPGGPRDIDGAPVPGVLATADPPDHERHRKVLTKHFSAGNIRAMAPAFQALVSDALSPIGPDGRCEWMEQVAEPLPMVMVARLLGFADEQAPQLKRLGYAMVERIGGFVPEERLQQLDVAGLEDMAPVIEAYTRARQNPTAYRDGIIGTVALAADDGELDDLEAIGILTLLIAAGGESTTSLLGTAVRILAERPDLQDQLRSDRAFVPTFVEEALRYDPPFRGHYRVVTRDTTLGETRLSVGAHLVLMWPAANRDPAAYQRPDEVQPDRSNPRYHLGFGWGIHLCIGAPLARLEAKLAVDTLLTHTRHFHIDEASAPLRYHPSLMVRRLTALPLVLQ
jgi:cytochrome P450 family 144